jgi:hypothetical protein
MQDQVPRTLTPLVVFAEPRTGSNLLFNMLFSRNLYSRYSRTYDTELFTLYEMLADYSHEDWRHVDEVYRKMSQDCGIVYPGNSTIFPGGNKSMVENPQALQKVADVFHKKRENPKELLHMLQQLPSFAMHGGYFVFKLFQSHLRIPTLGNPSNVIGMVRQTNPNAKFVILWRSSMVEAFVSYSKLRQAGEQVAFVVSSRLLPNIYPVLKPWPWKQMLGPMQKRPRRRSNRYWLIGPNWKPSSRKNDGITGW